MDSMRISVRPREAGMKIRHPVNGVLPDAPDGEGKWPRWIADSFTMRLIQEGAVQRVDPQPGEISTAAAEGREGENGTILETDAQPASEPQPDPPTPMNVGHESEGGL